MSIILVSFTLRIWCTDKLNGWHGNKYLRIIKKYFFIYSLDNDTRSLHKTPEVSYVEVSNVKLNWLGLKFSQPAENGVKNTVF